MSKTRWKKVLKSLPTVLYLGFLGIYLCASLIGIAQFLSIDGQLKKELENHKIACVYLDADGNMQIFSDCNFCERPSKINPNQATQIKRES
ncbi:MAG: hypothetical protein ACPGVO_11260 [Spirulinaceae cyanobacterium]